MDDMHPLLIAIFIILGGLVAWTIYDRHRSAKAPAPRPTDAGKGGP